MFRRLTLVALLAGTTLTLAGRSGAQMATTRPADGAATAPAAMPPEMPPGMMMPATMPASQPMVEFDPASPKGILVKLSTALDGGDAEALTAILLATSPVEEKILGAMTGQAKAIKHFRSELVKTFGDANATKLAGDPNTASADKNARLAAAEMTVDGDNATIRTGEESLTLKKVGGTWRLPITVMTGQLQPSDVDDVVDMMTLQSGMLDETADEVAAGKHKDIDATRNAMQSKMDAATQKRNADLAMRQVKEHLGSTTVPSTAPTTLPDAGMGPMQP